MNKKFRKSKYNQLLKLEIFDGMAELRHGKHKSSLVRTLFPPSMRAARRAFKRVNSMLFMFAILSRKASLDSSDWIKVAQTSMDS